MPQWQGATVTLGYTNKLVSLLNPRPDSSVVRAPGCKPDGPGFNPQSGHFSSFNNFDSGLPSVLGEFPHSLPSQCASLSAYSLADTSPATPTICLHTPCTLKPQLFVLSSLSIFRLSTPHFYSNPPPFRTAHGPPCRLPALRVSRPSAQPTTLSGAEKCEPGS